MRKIKSQELQVFFKADKDQKIYDISHSFFDPEKGKKNNLNEKINFIYNKKSNLINVLIDDKAKYGDLSKPLLVKIIEYANNNDLKGIIISVSKNNSEYYKIIESLHMIGFNHIVNHKSNKIGEKRYKILYMKINSEIDEIEDIII